MQQIPKDQNNQRYKPSNETALAVVASPKMDTVKRHILLLIKLMSLKTHMIYIIREFEHNEQNNIRSKLTKTSLIL